MSLLSVSHLTVSFERQGSPVLAVNDVSFGVGQGEIFGLVGESGSGKTTLCNALVGAVPKAGRILSGAIEVDEVDVLSAEAPALRQLRRSKVGFIPQNSLSVLNPVRSVRSQMREVINPQWKNRADERSKYLLSELRVPTPDRVQSVPPERGVPWLSPGRT